MDIYRRYASREHDKRHFTQLLASGHIKLRPLSSCFDTPESGEYAAKTIDYWRSVFENAAFFVGADESLFGPVLTVVYKNPSTDKLCTLSVSKYGCNVYENLILDSSSRFWPACENLPENMRRSNVRRALAVSNLKNYNQLWNNKGLVQVTQHWDETNAGALAASMESIDLPARDLGEKLLSLGLIQDQTIPSLMVDVVYANPSDPEDSTTAAENNKLVMHLGEQLEQLFDPLLEYSPQAMDIEYKTPENPTKPVLGHNENVQRVIEELLTVQANYTTDRPCRLATKFHHSSSCQCSFVFFFIWNDEGEPGLPPYNRRNHQSQLHSPRSVEQGKQVRLCGNIQGLGLFSSLLLQGICSSRSKPCQF